MDIDKIRYDLAMQSALAATIAEIFKGKPVNPAGLIPTNFVKFYRLYGDGEQSGDTLKNVVAELEKLK